MRLRILYLSRFIEHPATGGPQIRVDSSIKVLAKVSELHVVSLSAIDFVGGKQALKYFREITPNVAFAESVAPGVFFKMKALAGMMFRHVGAKMLGRTPNYQWIVDYLKRKNINILWVSYANLEIDLIKRIRLLMPRLVIIGDTDSVWSRFLARGVKYHRQNLTKEVAKAVQTEKSLMRYCDYVTAVSQVDAKYYKSLKGSAKVIIFPNYIDMNVPKVDSMSDNYLLLPGSYGEHSPMNDAAEWLITQIMPKVWEKYPNLKLVLAGKNSNLVMPHILDKRIERTGLVPSMTPYLANASVVLVPLRFESGTRYKILEAGQYKKAVVSTKLGSEGLDVTNEIDIIIANTPENFSTGIVKLVNNQELAARLGHHLYQYVETHNSLRVGAKYVKELLKEIEGF